MLSHPPSIEDIFAHYTVIFDTLERTGTVAYSLNALATTPTFVFPKKVTSSELLSNYCCLFFASPSECVLCSLDFTQSIYVPLSLSLFISLTDWLTDFMSSSATGTINLSTHLTTILSFSCISQMICTASQVKGVAMRSLPAPLVLSYKREMQVCDCWALRIFCFKCKPISISVRVHLSMQ